MVDLHAEVAALRPEIDRALASVLDAGAFVRGPFVGQFEEELARFLDGDGDAQVIGVGNGTDALQIALMAAGVGPGDEVVTTPFTFIATAEAAALLGARPVFVDIDPRTFNLDVEQLEGTVTERTKAIVPVHLYGQPADMTAVMHVAERHGLTVIEDAAQAVGAKWEGETAGLIGHAGCLSFYPSKNLGAYGDGGACLARDHEMAARMRRIANHGAERKYHHTEVGVNSRLDAIQAALLSVKLRHLPDWTARRRAAADAYDARLREGGAMDALGLALPYRDPRAHHAFHQYVLRVPSPDSTSTRRDALAAHLKAAGVPTMVYYPVPLHRLEVFAAEGHAEGDFPEAERAAREVLALPMHPWLTDGQIDRVGAEIERFTARQPVAA
jgi:dTDP-4-amino-4,6-dideoxygalactose transaminase